MKSVWYLLLVLCISTVWGMQPAFPTLFYGKVLLEDGRPAQTTVIAHWIDTDGQLQQRSVRTVIDNGGSFSFTDGYVLAAPGKEITLEVIGGETIKLRASPGTPPFELKEPLRVFELRKNFLIEHITAQGFDEVAVVHWTTSVPTNARVRYGPGVLDKTSEISGLAREHIMILKDLEPSTSYALAIIAEDIAGNRIESTPVLFQTFSKSINFDSMKENITETSFGLSFFTDLPCKAELFYGLESIKEDAITTTHNLLVKSLVPLNSYEYLLVCRGQGRSISLQNSFYTSTGDSPLQMKSSIWGHIVQGAEPAQGVQVHLQWEDVSGKSKEAFTETITDEQAVSLGDPSLVGAFVLKGVQAKPNSIIQVQVKGKTSSIRAQSTETHVFESLRIEKRLFPWYWLLLLILPCLAFTVRYAQKHQYSRINNAILNHVERLVEKPARIESIQEMERRKRRYEYAKTKLGLLLIESLLEEDSHETLHFSTGITRKLIEVKKGDKRSFLFDDIQHPTLLKFHVIEIIPDSVLITINDLPNMLTLEKNATQSLFFDGKTKNEIAITVVAVSTQSATIFFRLVKRENF